MFDTEILKVGTSFISWSTDSNNFYAEREKGSRSNLINQEKDTVISLVLLYHDNATGKPDVETTIIYRSIIGVA